MSTAEMKIAVIGLGHVGLPTALGLARLGWQVTGVDSDASIVSMINEGKCPFFEPELDLLLGEALERKNFRATHDISEAIRSCTILFICVGTPQRDNGDADLSAVESLALLIARNLNGYKLIVEKSTVPAVTGQWIQKTVLRFASARGPNGNGSRSPVPEFDVASNPEFLQEGKAVQNFLNPDRIVCGVTSVRARNLLKQVYASVDCPILFTDLTTAELIKHAANAFLAAKISFINMVADVCDEVGADVTQVAAGIGLDKRIGPHFLNAGLGFGGYCLPKDLRAFAHLAEQHNVDAALLTAIEKINATRAERFIEKLREALWILRGKTIGILGLAFKAGTDDMRDAPSLAVVEQLRAEGANLRLCDPRALATAKRLIASSSQVTFCDDLYEAADGAHALLIVTEWDDFRNLSYDRLHTLMELPVIVDGRNLLNDAEVRAAGFEYLGVGRSSPALHAPQIRPAAVA